MTDTTSENNKAPETTAPTAAPVNKENSSRREFVKNKRGPKRESRERIKPEFDQKIIQIRRVTRVTSGGRRMAFSVAMIIGNRKGKVGLGTGKGIDTAIAIEKALRDAKKHTVTIVMTKSNSIPHDVSTKFSSANIIMRPAPSRGLVAGSAVRDVLELAGITNVNAKVLSPSKNKLNIAKAAIIALSKLKKPKAKVALA